MGIQSDIVIIEQFLTDHPQEAVKLIENHKNEDIANLIDALPGSSSALLVTHMNMITSINCLQMVTIRKVTAIIEILPMEFVSILVRNFPNELQKEILRSMSREKSTFLEQTLTFSEGTVGSLMDPYMFTFFDDMSVSDALKMWKNQIELDENSIYVINRNHKLVGVITLIELMRAKSGHLLGTMMNRNVIKIHSEVKVNLIQNHPGWQEYSVLPVVDNNDTLQGILYYRSLLRYEDGRVKHRIPQHLIKASSALGELYRLGMTSLIQGASLLYNQPDEKNNYNSKLDGKTAYER